MIIKGKPQDCEILTRIAKTSNGQSERRSVPSGVLKPKQPRASTRV